VIILKSSIIDNISNLILIEITQHLTYTSAKTHTAWILYQLSIFSRIILNKIIVSKSHIPFINYFIRLLIPIKNNKFYKY